ncbi:MAG TPA: CerR family C-terminal domain-containing protein [Verrucomicrobiae bacterium]|nr:CerR family C-terminal domain-containing protein [Verrucomicrobiae bacterium]
MRLKTETKPVAPHQDETRQQLLEAAGEVFADAGFRNATVREICRRAGANIAAVNYHFGDKERLYTEVLSYSHGKTVEKYPPLLGLSEDAPAEKKLRAFIFSLLLRIFDTGPNSWHGRLMAREMIEPSPALDSLIEERIRPMSAQLFEIVAEILNRPGTDDCVRLCAFSVVSQCTFYKHCNPVMLRLYPKSEMDAAQIESTADHITKFSLAALKSFINKK